MRDRLRSQGIRLVTSTLRRWFRPAATASIAAPRSVLILKPCCLGDVLLTTPLVAAIRTRYPEATITYAVGQWSRPMVATSQHVDAIVLLPDHWTPGALLAVARVLRSRAFDVVFVPDRSPTLTLLAWLAGIRQRVGLDSAGRGFAYTHRVPVPSIVMHEADVYRQLAPAAGLPPAPQQLFFFPSPKDQAEADVLARRYRAAERPLIALHPGGGQNPGMTLHRKRWLPERWAAVADALVAQHDARIILIGGPSDQEVVAAVARAMQSQAIRLVQQWQWGLLGALLSRCDLFLGHDTGMMHLATAVGTPTVAVFGPSDPQIYGPYGPATTYVWRPTPESPCFYEGFAAPHCPCAEQCMRNVAVADVLQAAEQFIRSHSRNAEGA